MIAASRSNLTKRQLARRAAIGESRRARSRASLMEAANSLFATHGFETPSIDDVISGAGVSRGTFYNHFTTRDELFWAVAAEIADWSTRV